MESVFEPILSFWDPLLLVRSKSVRLFVLSLVSKRDAFRRIERERDRKRERGEILSFWDPLLLGGVKVFDFLYSHHHQRDAFRRIEREREKEREREGKKTQRFRTKEKGVY